MNAKDYISAPLRDLIGDTAAKTPTPGGGSVSAYVGALATALGQMVVNYTIGKPKYAAHDLRLRAVSEELRRSGEMSAQLAAEDMAAYGAYSESRKTGDAAAQQRALMLATTVPLEIVAVAAAVLARFDEVKGFLNVYLTGDLQAATLLIEAVAGAAALNVRSNLKGLTAAHDARQIQEQLDTLLSRCREHKASVLGTHAG